jgi:hypothetical protein
VLAHGFDEVDRADDVVGIVEHRLFHRLADGFAAGKVDDGRKCFGAECRVDLVEMAQVALKCMGGSVGGSAARGGLGCHNKPHPFFFTFTNFMPPALSPANSCMRT